MECNKDEAFRAKDIAEEKLLARNISGAKKFALKAQSLYPGLEGMPQLVAAIDVHGAAEKKVNGETDWYGILGVNAKADHESIRKQYRKLALMLHPDKNKSLGADGAFKLVAQSWSLLSDKEKRAAYDKKIHSKIFQKVSIPSNIFTGSRRTNDSVKSRKVSKAGRATNASVPATSQGSKSNTFWTMCHRCKMQYEYLRVYINHNLLCPHCREPFLAIETGPPATNGRKIVTDRSQIHSTGKQSYDQGTTSFGNNVSFTPASDVGGSSSYSYSYTNADWSPFSNTGSPSIAKAASVVRQAYAKAKRQRVEAQAASKKEEALKRKNNPSKRQDDAMAGGLKTSLKRRRMFCRTTSTNSQDVASESVDRVDKTCQTYDASNSVLLDYRSLFMQKAKKIINQRLHDSGMSKTEKFDDALEKDKTDYKGEEALRNADVNMQDSKLKCDSIDVRINPLTLRRISMDVSSSEFHSFDIDRTENCFGERQVWAAYDIGDGMPRCYAFIDAVISLDPFKIRITWLSSKNNCFGSLHWFISGFSQVCGDFRPIKHETYDSVTSFSHKVRWRKGQHGVIRIYPRKGEVWALYRNWSSSWNELTMNDVIYQYDLVEVLEDYNEGLGVMVIPLIKVAGFKTIFKHHLNFKEARMILHEEIYRFSHQIPSRLLPGLKGPKKLKGCKELDPAAIPSELQVIIDDQASSSLMKEALVEGK